MKNKFLLFYFFLISNLDAQDFLSHRAAPGELVTRREPSGYLNANLTAPGVPVRTMAEWEEIEYLTITWANSLPTAHKVILSKIAQNAQSECKVIILHNASVTESSIISFLQAQGVVIGVNILFKTIANDSIWIRDYGQNSAYLYGVDSLVIVDWIYNRPSRVNDDAVPGMLANDLGIAIYETAQSPDDLVHTGGNFMSDGAGTGFSSNLVLNENPNKTNAQINDIMSRYMGINTYIKMTTLPNDVIHHIDMHIKLLNEETLLVGQYPLGISDGPQIETNLQYILNNFTNAFGEPYKVIRIPMPPDAGVYPLLSNNADYRTYTNAVFVNKMILLPTYEQQYDTTALRIWREAMPGYNVVGIDCNGIINSLGAIHCITHSIGVQNPLLIVHNDLEDTYSNAPYTVNARIQHKTGIASATLYYKTDLNPVYQSVAILNLTGNPFTYSADIPGQPAGTKIYYYISATANSGKTNVRPLPAPAGYWNFRILEPVSTATLQEAFFKANVYPNPATGITSLNIEVEKDMDLQVSVFNTVGIEVKTLCNENLNKGNYNFSFDAGNLPSGLYFVRMRSGEFVQSVKFVVAGF